MVPRLPGQSIREQKEHLIENRFLPVYMGSAFLWILWMLDVWRLYNHQTPQPRVELVAAIIATVGSLIVFGWVTKKMRRLNHGERGELTVAAALEDLRAVGYRIFHDLRRDKFNIDHVVVGPGGVFAVETKFRSGQGEIEFRNGEGLFVGGFPDEKDCLTQARGCAREVNKLIQENCQKFEWVTPLVVFVGDWRVKNNWQTTDARVFTPPRLVRYIGAQQPRLTKSEITLIASHLERSAKS